MEQKQEFDGRLRGFLDAEGRVTAYPAKRGKKMLVLFYLAGKLEPGQEYSEREINEAIDRWRAPDGTCDHCTLRRELYDCRFLERERDSSRYWMSDPQPQPADFGL